MVATHHFVAPNTQCSATLPPSPQHTRGLRAFDADSRSTHHLRRTASTLLSGRTLLAATNCNAWLAPLRLGSAEADTARPIAGEGFTAEQTPLPDCCELRRRFRLTERESEVALLLAQRRTNKEIARLLAVSTHTALHHTERVLRKLGISSRRHVLPAITSPVSTHVVCRLTARGPEPGRN